MKKYLVLGIAVLALAAILLSFPWNQESKAGPGGPAFYGSVQPTKSVWAFKGGASYEGYVRPDSTYYINIPPDSTGTYCVTDGCQHFNRYWDGENGQEVNFCIPPPFCPCN